MSERDQVEKAITKIEGMNQRELKESDPAEVFKEIRSLIKAVRMALEGGNEQAALEGIGEIEDVLGEFFYPDTDEPLPTGTRVSGVGTDDERDIDHELYRSLLPGEDD